MAALNGMSLSICRHKNTDNNLQFHATILQNSRDAIDLSVVAAAVTVNV